jgi:hypothetical protein
MFLHAFELFQPASSLPALAPPLSGVIRNLDRPI